jgi:hypothetical protein
MRPHQPATRSTASTEAIRKKSSASADLRRRRRKPAGNRAVLMAPCRRAPQLPFRSRWGWQSRRSVDTALDESRCGWASHCMPTQPCMARCVSHPPHDDAELPSRVEGYEEQ